MILLKTIAVLCLTAGVVVSQDYEREFQHDLIQDSKVFTYAATETINTVLHTLGYHAELDTEPTTSFTPGFTCNAQEYVVEIGRNFLRGSGSAVADGLVGILGSSFTEADTSEEMADYIMANFSKTFPQAAKTVLSTVPSFDGGHGSGFGFEIFCGTDVLMTFGGGGGGGVTVSANILMADFGGGGGGQTGAGATNDTVDVGGGTGCIANSTLIPECRATADGGGSGFDKFAAPVRAALDKCSNPIVCTGGGGGGGFSLSSGISSCGFGGSYSFQSSAQLTKETGAAVKPVAGVECPGSKSQRYDLAVAVASDVCTSACIDKPNFYSQCYCPCFKGKIEGLGLSWGFAMECTV